MLDYQYKTAVERISVGVAVEIFVARWCYKETEEQIIFLSTCWLRERKETSTTCENFVFLCRATDEYFISKKPPNNIKWTSCYIFPPHTNQHSF